MACDNPYTRACACACFHLQVNAGPLHASVIPGLPMLSPMLPDNWESTTDKCFIASGLKNVVSTYAEEIECETVYMLGPSAHAIEVNVSLCVGTSALTMSGRDDACCCLHKAHAPWLLPIMQDTHATWHPCFRWGASTMSAELWWLRDGRMLAMLCNGFRVQGSCIAGVLPAVACRWSSRRAGSGAMTARILTSLSGASPQRSRAMCCTYRSTPPRKLSRRRR